MGGVGQDVCVLWLVWAAGVAASAASASAASPVAGSGLTLTRFNNTALRGAAVHQEVAASLEGIPDCGSGTCGHPSSMLLTGRIAPPSAGNYGFNVTLTPPLAVPSPIGYARLWVNDHLLYPNYTGSTFPTGRYAPLYIPLPPRAFTFDGLAVEHAGAAGPGSYEVRLEYVCLAPAGCNRSVSLRWATYPQRTVAAGIAPAGSGVVVHPGAGCPGHDLVDCTSSAPTAGECGAACEANPNCAVAVWDARNRSFTCRLKHACPSQRLQNGSTLIRVRQDQPAPRGGSPADASGPPPFEPIPAKLLIPEQSTTEATRRALAQTLQQGWGTFYYSSKLAWMLLPEGLLVRAAMYRLSTGELLPPDGLAVNKPQLADGAEFGLQSGLHSYNQSYIQLSFVWQGVNISLATTVDDADSSQLTLIADARSQGPSPASPRANVSDFVLLLLPNVTAGRSGTFRSDATSITMSSFGLRERTLHLLQGSPARPRNTTGLPFEAYLAVRLDEGSRAVLSTDRSLSPDAVIARTARYRQREAETLEPYGEWAPVKDAIQTVLAWSIMYDPREGLVAPEFPYAPGGGFSHTSVDGDTAEGLFCWDGSFASYMLSLDALDLSISNLVQVIKMRTAAGFVPSLTVGPDHPAGTMKTRDHSNPPVTGRVLREITKRWGPNRTRWVVELCFDDLFTWNTWMFTQRREAPLGLLSWGSDPYLWAPDGTRAAATGMGSGAGHLESGLDNGPMYDNLPFNVTGRYVQDEYAAGYTGMFLMDCLAQIELAQLIGRQDAADVLQARYDLVSKAMVGTLWNASAAFFQNKRSADLSPVMKMAPTSFYPLQAGQTGGGPTVAQAEATVAKHLTNPARFGVWPSKEPPTDPPLAPEGVRPLVQWYSHKCARGYPCPGSPHALCASLACNLNESYGNFIQRIHGKARYEGLAFPRLPAAGAPQQESLAPLFNYACGNGSDLALGPQGWRPAHGGPCVLTRSEPAMFVYRERAGPSAADLAELELWYRPGDHYAVASEDGKQDAAASNYTHVMSLGFVWPAPASPNASSRYALPCISRDDPTYSDQDYWHGRIWGPMVQLVYWALEPYKSKSTVVQGAVDGLVAQSRELLLKEWLGYDANSTGFAGIGRYVFENYGADTGEGYAYSSSASPLYSWGGLLGFVGLLENGYYAPAADP